MILLQLDISNPFSKRFEIIKCLAGSTPIPNKNWELQFNKTNQVVNINLHVTTRRDHSGVFFSVGLLGYECIFNLYDSRHWDQRQTET